jgi:hypothetical protein
MVTKGRKASQALEPLSAWCTLEADAFDAMVAIELRKALEAVVMIGEPTWRTAADGDVCAAIGLALRLVPGQSTEMGYDLIMTALVACAAEGDLSACIVTSFVLRSRVKVTSLSRRLAASWADRAIKLRSERFSDGAAS